MFFLYSGKEESEEFFLECVKLELKLLFLSLLNADNNH